MTRAILRPGWVEFELLSGVRVEVRQHESFPERLHVIAYDLEPGVGSRQCDTRWWDYDDGFMGEIAAADFADWLKKANAYRGKDTR